MRSIDLLPNEGVIAQFDNVGCESPDFKGFERGELTLTNMSLVFTYTQIKMFGKDIDHTVKVFIGYEITRSMTAEMAYIERLIALRDWHIGGLIDRIGEIYSSTFVKIGCNLLKSSLGNHEIG